MRKIISAYLIFATVSWAISGVLCFADDNATSTEPESGAVMANTTSTAAAPGQDGNNGLETEGQEPPATTTIEFGSAAAPVLTGNELLFEATSTQATSTEEITTDDAVGAGSPRLEGDPGGAAATSSPESAATSTDETAGSERSEGTGTTTVGSMIDPVIAAQWVMTGDGTDDREDFLGQIDPSGRFEVNREFSVCGVVLADAAALKGVYAQIFYPREQGFAAGDARGRMGCGQLAGPALQLDRLDAAAGFNLFCEKIQKSNNNLPWFKTEMQYNDVCGTDGQIMAGGAQVYCGKTSLAFDDIAGNYELALMARIGEDLYSKPLIGNFEYIGKAEFEIDFSHVDYGRVKENIAAAAAYFEDGENAVSTRPVVDVADLTAGSGATAQNAALVRNSGNVPAIATVWQDDMGMGKTGDVYNITYQAKFADESDWRGYAPFETLVFPKPIEPGQAAGLEFMVRVADFPAATSTHFGGQMKIEARPLSG